jgi:ribonuclease P protein component
MSEKSLQLTQGKRLSRRQTETLRSGAQFRRVYSEGQRFSNSCFAAFFLKTETSLQRLGVTVTRKTGSAVIRNRCKRRLREVFRLRDRGPLSGTGYDLVINVRSRMIETSHEELQRAFASMMNKFRDSLKV